jgi:hypothetical protein
MGSILLVVVAVAVVAWSLVLGIVGPLVERGCWQYYYYSDGGIEIESVDVAIFLQDDDVD